MAVSQRLTQITFVASSLVNFNLMKNDLLKVICWVVGIIVVAWIIGKAIVQGKEIMAEAQLMAQRLEHQHEERMADKFIQYHHQAFGCSRHFFYSPDNLRPSV